MRSLAQLPMLLAGRGKSDPVRGLFYVDGCRVIETGRRPDVLLRGVLVADRLKASSATHRTRIPAARRDRLPLAGQRLPVIFDRADPHRITIDWSALGAAS